MKKKSLGFTLIETLVVIFLIGIVLVAGGNIFFGIMKGASKAEVEREVKQNGDYALAIMERMIRNSRGVVVCDEDQDELTITNLDFYQTTFERVPDSDLGINRVASSGAYLTGENVDVLSLNFDCIYEPETSSDEKDIRRVEINFSLIPRGGEKEVPETYTIIDFKTSISLRNF